LLEYFVKGLATQKDEVTERGRIAIQGYEKLCPETKRRSLQRNLKGLLEKGLQRESGRDCAPWGRTKLSY